MLNRAMKERIIDGTTIVLSVLLAFAIDAFWAELEERDYERAALESLHADFLINRRMAASVISYHERALNSFVLLTQLTDEEILGLPLEKVEEFVSYLANPLTFNAIRGSIDALVHSGNLNILRDQELRKELMKFANILDDSEEDVYYLSESSITVWHALADYGGPWRTTIQLQAEECMPPAPNKYCYVNEKLKVLPIAQPDDLLELRTDSILMGHIQLDTMNAVYYSAEVREIGLQIETILSLVERNLVH